MAFAPFGIFTPVMDCMIDAAQRGVLFCDVMRQRGNQYRERLAETVPHVLEFEVELLVDGRTLVRSPDYWTWMRNVARIEFPFVFMTELKETTMAEINKLSVGKALKKLRTDDAQKSKTGRLDEKRQAADEELQRLRAATRGLRQGPQGGPIKKS
jgi:hypothetical protein